MITHGAWVELLKPGLAWAFFSANYPKRQRGENFGRYMATKRREFRAWIARFPQPEDD